MSASTQGTPFWLMRLEQIKDQLTTENYIWWLLTKAEEHDIPAEVIKAQLERSGYELPQEVAEEPQAPVAVAETPVAVAEPRKAGRPAKMKG
jgi:hypothetical protein